MLRRTEFRPISSRTSSEWLVQLAPIHRRDMLTAAPGPSEPDGSHRLVPGRHVLKPAGSVN